MVINNSFDSSSDVFFIIKNNSSINRAVKIFNTKVYPGGTLDLMKIPGVTEEDIRADLIKGPLKKFLSQGTFTIVSSSINFATNDSSHGAFLRKVNLPANNDNLQALSQATWYIDPTNGSDSNDGLTSTTALKTHNEFVKRIGTLYPRLTGAVSTAIASINLVTVNILGSLPSSDPVRILPSLGANTLLAYVGTPVTVRTGTLTSGTVAKVRTTNTPQQLEDTVTPFTSADIGRRIRITSGANTGQFAWGAKVTSGILRTSSMSTPTMTPIPDCLIQTTLTTGTAVSGDPYVVETLPQITLEVIGGQSPIGGTNTLPTIGFMNLDIQNSGGTQQTIALTPGNVQLTFKGCKFSGQAATGLLQTRPNFLNCCFVQPVIAALIIQGGSVVRGGLCLGNVASRGYGISNFDDDFMVQGGTFQVQATNGTSLACVCVFDSPSEGFGIGNLGIPVGAACTNGNLGTHLLWGSGNATVGIKVYSGSTLSYTSNVPVVTGTAGGDFALSVATTAIGYDAAGVAGSTFTTNGAAGAGWTNLAASVATPGGGGAAHNPQANAHIVKLT